MPETRLLTEFGIGTSLRRQDYTEAALRAVRDALWRNSINLAELFGARKEAMILDVEIGVARPDAVDVDEIKAAFPYGQPRIHVRQGGLDVPRPDAPPNVIANVAISVSLDLEPRQ
ncbi:Lin0512 family protein [Marimonas arenosa]|uniref:Lin0512 family protein n=1 Tax=Marimonas arenosa TaxID=1795305 RepID=A0AAE3WDI1_9RHOB|nr:Lin0512 family protein [Marimonas arenosa]MDQ2090702.1 Lin0512 family protein [Marimonas arenosa]